MVTMYATGDRPAALGLAGQSVEHALRSGSDVARARAFAIQSEMQARGGDARRSLRALELAGLHLAGDASGDPGQSVFNQARLNGFEGLCRLQLGHADAAQVELRRSADALDSAKSTVQRSIILVDLARAHVHQGDPESGCDILGTAAGSIAATRGRVATQRLHQVRRDLEPWRAERFVRDLDARLLSAALFSAP